MEAHLAPTQPTQVNKVTTSCEISSGPQDTRYCMEDPEQAFIEYASSRTNETGGKWYTFKPEQNNLYDTYNPSWRSHPNLSSFNNNPRSFNNQSNLEGLVSNFMASQDARLSKFESDFKQQQSEMTNKIDIVLNVFIDRIVGTLPSDTVKKLKLSTSLVSSTRFYPNMDPHCSNHIHGSINTVTIHSEQRSNSYDEKLNENKEEEKNSPENIHAGSSIIRHQGRLHKGDDREFMFIEIIRNNDDTHEDGPEEEGSTTTKGVEVEYFDIFPTRSELANHKYLMCSPIPSIFLRNPIITEGCPSNLKIPYFMIVVDISSIIDPRLSQVVIGKPLVKISNMTHDSPEGVVIFTNRTEEVAYKMPHIIEQYNSLLDLEKEHTKSVYLRNEEDKRRGVEYVMSKILRFYKEFLEHGPEYVTGMDDKGEVT
ncbi:hypothetical protein Tco_1156071 [Tanacetum coccineum]